MAKKYSLFHVQGGFGKHIAATAVAKCIKNNHPSRELILTAVYTEIYQNLPFVDRVYQLGNTSYYYQTYVEDMDSLIFANEPYFTTDHVNKKLPLIHTWSKMYGLKYKGEMPQITFNHLQKKIAKEFWTNRSNGKPILVIQTNGGLLNEQRPYLWARDMPIALAQKLVDHYEKDYHIFQITKPTGEVLDGVEVINTPMSNMELVSILLQSEKRIFIDSCMQHAAAALKMPSVVLWNGTSPKVFGWDMHTNIQARKPAKFKLPNSVFFDFDFIGVEAEYPYVDEEEDIFDFDKIIEAVG
jgi:ADP-heptose:LPS heptosyltransferase